MRTGDLLVRRYYSTARLNIYDDGGNYVCHLPAGDKSVLVCLASGPSEDSRTMYYGPSKIKVLCSNGRVGWAPLSEFSKVS